MGRLEISSDVVLQPVVSKIQSKIAVVSAEMGYGHLRSAQTLSDFLNAPLWRADQPPFATAAEKFLWSTVRQANEALCKTAQLPGRLGNTMSELMNWGMRIEPDCGCRDLSAPTAGVLALSALIEHGFGRCLVKALQASGMPLLTTFYATSVLGQMAGLRHVYCVVTDADINRVWVPRNAASPDVVYFAPSQRVANRLHAYGVPACQIDMTGFPLPIELLGDREAAVARHNLARRLVRLDPNQCFIRNHHDDISKTVGVLPSDEYGQPPLLTFAVGGAGAQQHLSDQFLESLRAPIKQDRLRVALVAGTRRDVRLRFEKQIEHHGLRSALAHQLQVLFEPDFLTYYRKFNQLLAETDALWTKPSELVFYAALGIPLILSAPLGTHEMYNRTWLIESGAAIDQRCPSLAANWLGEWLDQGVLANLAWAGFENLPKLGTYHIAERIEFDSRQRQETH